MHKSEIQKLINELYEAAKVYYQNMDEDLLMENDEFDQKLSLLKELLNEPQNEEFLNDEKTQQLLEKTPGLGTTPTENISTHKIPMLSLAKAKNEKELQMFINRTRKSGALDFKLQAKLDGFALSATYQKGELTKLLTRGSGTVGEEITYLMEDKLLTIKGLPRVLNDKTFSGEVRGELFFTHEQFQKVDNERFAKTAQHFKNSRNACVGLMKKAKLGLDYPVEFTFSTYSALKEETYCSIIDLPEDFITVDQLTHNQNKDLKLTNFSDDKDLFKAVEEFGEARKNFTIPTDGVVIKPTNEAQMLKKMGLTSHHPISQIAYKYMGDLVQTTVENIIVTVGKTGKLTPKAIFTKVLVDGSDLQNASLHNYNWLIEKDIRIGSIVTVFKANDIIPQVESVVLNPTNTTPVEIPTHCPICETTLEYDKNDVYPPKTLTCPNFECSSRDYFVLKAAIMKSALNIDGLGEATLSELYENGRIKTIADLYSLTLDELKISTSGYSPEGNPRKLGEERAKHILEYIEKSKKTPLPKLLSALGVEQLGINSAKDLVKALGTFEAIEKATVNDISALEGFGDIKAEKIVEGLKKRSVLIATLRSHGVSFGEGVNTHSSTTAGKLDSLSFAISGEVPQPFKNRNEWVDYVEANGGVFHSAPKKETSYMVADKNENSSKIQKAKQLGIEFLSAQQFSEKYC